MKKLLTIFTVILLSLFILKQNLYSKEDYSKYKEEYKRIYFENLNSKNINELFEGLSGVIIEIEVKTKRFSKSYRINTAMTYNIEQKLTELVLKDLSLLGDQELTAIYITSGFTVTRIDLRCTEETLNIIKERSTQHD